MTTIAGVKLGNMSQPKESLTKPGKISPDPYSYAHRINLNQDAATKAGMGETPKVGDVFHVMGEGHVHSVSTDGDGLQVGLQLRKIGVKKAPKGKSGGGALGAVSQGIKDAG